MKAPSMIRPGEIPQPRPPRKRPIPPRIARENPLFLRPARRSGKLETLSRISSISRSNFSGIPPPPCTRLSSTSIGSHHSRALRRSPIGSPSSLGAAPFLYVEAAKSTGTVYHRIQEIKNSMCQTAVAYFPCLTPHMTRPPPRLMNLVPTLSIPESIQIWRRCSTDIFV